MSDKLKRTIIGAVIAIALAAGVSYGLISQPTADKLQQQANQTLATDGQDGTASSTGQPSRPVPERPQADPQPLAPNRPDGQTPPASGR